MTVPLTKPCGAVATCWLRTWSVALVCALGAGCRARDPIAATPYYDVEIGPLLEARCAKCHAGDKPEAGWSADSYLSVIACTDDGTPVTMPADETAPLLEVLDRPDHAELLDADERALVRAFIEAGAPSRDAAMHPVGWLDPRSDDWHGAALRAEGFVRMLRLSAPGACGRCHAGAPATDFRLERGPQSAPACTSCHDEPAGVLACGTCHGRGSRALPPRDGCFFPDGPKPFAHEAHVGKSAIRDGSLDCSSCHPSVDAEHILAGKHANGEVDVELTDPLAGDDASYDSDTERCAVACHTRGGARDMPRWTDDEALGCGDCHGAPPEDHYAGACDRCHPGVDATGSALDDVSHHLDGHVDLGDGSSECGACHGEDGDPWPHTGAHLAHRDALLSGNVECASCHVVPDEVRAEGHLDRTPGAEVTFGGLALARGAEPSYDAEEKRCSGVACHGAGLAGGVDARPRWRQAGAGEAQCGSCHAIPPPPPHSEDPGCQAVICHGGEIAPSGSGPGISLAGRMLHIDGTVNAGGR